jgi:hypothetical protein
LFPAKPAKTSGVIIEFNGTLKNAGSKPARNGIGMAQAIRDCFTRWFDASVHIGKNHHGGDKQITKKQKEKLW